jgi:hypothetical protein
VSPGEGQAGDDMRVAAFRRRGNGRTEAPSVSPDGPAHKSVAEQDARLTRARRKHFLKLRPIAQVFVDFIG